MVAMRYEVLVGSAFGLKDGVFLGRHGDPAALATTDIYSDSNLSRVKACVAYSFEIFRNDILGKKHDLPDGEQTKIESFTDRAIKVKSIKDMSDLIDEYYESVIDKYYDNNRGVMTLSP